jgi:hypothetical protein
MENNEIHLKLLNKLIANLIPNSDKRNSEKYQSYFLRLLNSRMCVTSSNEVNIFSLILDKCNTDIRLTERVQNLYSKLTTKKTLKRRWACLYLLYRLSQDSESSAVPDSSKVLQTIFHDYNNTNNSGIKNETHFQIMSENNEIAETGNTKKEQRESSSNVVVNVNKTNKIITEKDILSDLIFVFQGIDGHFINYNSVSNSYVLNPMIPFNDNILDIVSVLNELGWLYRKVNSFLNYLNEANIPSQFVQSFSFALQTELNEYYQLISLFKKMNTKIEEAEGGSPNESQTEELSFKKLLLWTFEPMERMKWLATACESIRSN